jgi:hypothetical protein
MAASTVFQLRADPELFQRVKSLAAKRQMSVNRYLIDAVKAKLAIEKDIEWRNGFEAMGNDPDMDVEFMLPAAREVVVGD